MPPCFFNRHIDRKTLPLTDFNYASNYNLQSQHIFAHIFLKTNRTNHEKLYSKSISHDSGLLACIVGFGSESDTGDPDAR